MFKGFFSNPICKSLFVVSKKVTFYYIFNVNLKREREMQLKKKNFRTLQTTTGEGEEIARNKLLQPFSGKRGFASRKTVYGCINSLSVYHFLSDRNFIAETFLIHFKVRVRLQII
jgi:hypothetical protein